MSTVLEAALTYAQRGWRVVPICGLDRAGGCSCPKGSACLQAGKHPRPQAWYYVASTDRDKLIDWFYAWDDANIGIATGSGSAFFAIDVDPAHGGEKSLREIGRVYGQLPLTLQHRIGSGGQHLLFANPPNQLAVVDAALIELLKVEFGAIEVSEESEQGQ